jgi:succinate dehydrogenase hydrophobic anchor subunit
MWEKLRNLWREYNLSLVLLALFLVSWVLHGWTGWRKFAAEQSQHKQPPAVFGDDGYIWDFLAATFENWQSEFLQLLAMVVLTSFLVHRGSAESKDSNDRMEAKLDELQKRLDQLTESNGRQPRRGKEKVKK